MTQRIKAIDPGMAKGKAKELLDAVVNKYGGAPNSFKTMAHSPDSVPNCDRGLGDQWLPVLPFRFYSDRQGLGHEG
jgi:hypothetical protein